MAKRNDEKLNGIDEDVEDLGGSDSFALPLDVEAGEKDPAEYTDKESDDNDDLQRRLSAAIGSPDPSLSAIQSPEAELMASPAPSKAPSRLDQYKDYMEQYKKLQQGRKNSDLVSGLAAAGAQIGQSMAGKYSGQFQPDMSGVQVLNKMAERPVQDFEQGQVVQSRGLQLKGLTDAADPASPQSRLVRQYLNQRLFKDNPLGEDISANDAMMLLKTVGKPGTEKASQVPLINQKTGEKTTGVWHPIQQTFTDLAGMPLGADYIRDYRAQSFVDPMSHERLGFSGGTGKVTGALTGPGVNRGVPAAGGPEGKPVELTRNMLTSGQAKQLDSTRKSFLTEVRDDRKAVNSADRVLQVLDAGQSVGDLPAEIQDQMSRAFGQTGHITDAQMGRALGRSDWKSKLNLAKSMFFEGKIDDENRQFLMDVMKVIRDQNQQFIRNKAKAHVASLHKDFSTSDNLRKYKISPHQIENLMSVEESASSAEKPQKAIIKKGYNAEQDKTQLIYDDGTSEIVDGRR